MPVEVGSVTFKAAATDTAASAAFPPFARISKPAATARGCEAATIPRLPTTGERRDEKIISLDLNMVYSFQSDNHRVYPIHSES
jgi:hypothetical protein